MYRQITVKSVLNKKKSRDSWFLDDYTLNPYEGCAFNCLYCYVRGSKYGVNMEEGLAVKTNVLEQLDKQLSFRFKKNEQGIIALSSATDPYMRIEESARLTEGCLHLINKYRFPVLMITKSDLILRDIPILKEIDKNAIHAPDLAPRLKHGAIISFSFSTLDKSIADKLEPGAPPPIKRLEALKRIKDAGLYVGVNLLPLLPFINDTTESLEHFVTTFKDAGADYILAGGLTLFGNDPADSKVLYYKFLERNFPQLIPDYKKMYRIFFMPPKNYNDQLMERIRNVCQKYKMKDKITA